MRFFIFLIYSFLIFQDAYANVSPFYKEVEQRGYPHTSDSVLFPDGTKCSISDFNNQDCGTEWFIQDYCIEEGKNVWDEDRCCEGLSPTEDENGQKICSKKGWDFSFFSFWLGLFIPFAFFAYISFSIKKKLKKRHRSS